MGIMINTREVLELAAEGMYLYETSRPEYKMCLAVLQLYAEVGCEELRFSELWEQFSALDKQNQDLIEAASMLLENDGVDGTCYNAVRLYKARQNLITIINNAKLNKFCDDLASKQEPLGEEFSKVLYDNLDDLYEK
jgi:hypothetical protein